MSEVRRYEILSVLGAGGFGTVYRARFVGEGGFSKEVALKVLKPDMEGVADVAKRLRDEARVLGLLRHRAIVQVDRLTQLDGRWTVVMEYIEGQDLSRLIRLGPVPPSPALEVTAEVAGALDAAWTRPGPNGQPLRLVHRDLKPSNIRLTRYGEVKVLDFGIARAEFDAREALTRSLSFGTPDYMSPERLDHQGDTSAGDVYALGCVLLEMLVARRLGRSSANAERHAARVEQARQLLREAGVDPQVCSLVLRCLAYTPAERPTPAELERLCLALSRDLGGEPLRAWAESRVAMLPAPSAAPDAPVLGAVSPGAVSPGAVSPGAVSPGSGQQPIPAGEVSSGPPAALPTSALEPVELEVGAENLTGSVLVEGAAPQTFPLPESAVAPIAAPAPTGGPRWALLGAGLGALAVLGVVLKFTLGGAPTPSQPSGGEPVEARVAAPSDPSVSGPAPEPSPPVAAAVSAPGVAAPAVPAPGVAAPGSSGSSPAQSRAPGSAGSPARPAPDPASVPVSAPEPAPPAPARVSASGADEVWLVGGTGRVELGEVPPGAYAVWARYPQRDAEKQLELTLGPGQTVVLSCSPTFACKPR